MKFTSIGRTMGDETTPYKVTDYEAKTVVEFINEVLTTHPGEWGKFAVKKKDRGFLFAHHVEYDHGELKGEIPDEWQYVEIGSIKSRGGWSNMDYMITPKEKTTEKELVEKLKREHNLAGFDNCETVSDLVRELKCDCIDLQCKLRAEQRRREELEMKILKFSNS